MSGRVHFGGFLLLLAGAFCAPARGAGSIALDHLASLARLEMPESSREPVDGPVPISVSWTLATTVKGVRTWEAPLPVRTRSLFFHRAPDDMTVLRRLTPDSGWIDAEELEHDLLNGGEGSDGTWSFTDRSILVRRPAREGPPRPGEYGVQYTRAAKREADLNRATSAREGAAFAFRSVQVDDDTRHGILLPAPATAAFDLAVPEGAVLDLDEILVPPEAADPALASDGATFEVRVTAGGLTSTVLSVDPALGTYHRHRIDLSDWGGREVELSFATLPGRSSLFDYVFVAEPVVHVPSADPPRVVMVFVDTLRTDHMSLHGYERDTTPNIDAWAAGGSIFEQARSVAPWTLPTARTLLSGVQPERWGAIPALHERFAEAGWATGFFAGNVYLSSNFEMSGSWGVHRCVNWPRAEVQVDRALGFLDDHRDQPAFVVVHFMDLHLPYNEPLAWRRRFAGPPPRELPSADFLRPDVVRAAPSMGEAGKQYVRDRYDNSLAYLDDEVARLLGALDDGDTVVFLSDHGEEFWDHEDFEHGHTLYDELIHVPLVVRGPGFPALRTDTPVSLLDVAPTLARAAGLPFDDMTGWPVQDVVDGTRAQSFADRPMAFGRPLYGMRQWGAWHRGRKYLAAEGRERVFDTSSDPREKRDLRVGAAELPRWRETLARAIGWPVGSGFRLETNRSSSHSDYVAELYVPGGIASAYVGDDPTASSEATVEIDGETARATWKGGGRGAREIFVFPTRKPEEVALDVELKAIWSGTTEVEQPRAKVAPAFDGSVHTIVRARVMGRSVAVTYAVAPLAFEGGGIGGYNDEVHGELQALGYVE